MIDRPGGDYCLILNASEKKYLEALRSHTAGDEAYSREEALEFLKVKAKDTVSARSSVKATVIFQGRMFQNLMPRSCRIVSAQNFWRSWREQIGRLLKASNLT
jgi:hypothetical protein